MTAAYQGDGWSERTASLREEIGVHWSARASQSEYRPLREVLLAPPDPAWPPVENPNTVQHIDTVDFRALREQFAKLAAAYESLGVAVHLMPPPDPPEYNLMFARDLFMMTPEGAVLSRMASTVRAGEERHAARAIARLDIPILRTIGGRGTAEGADLLWAAPDLVLVGTGNRTNADGCRQVTECLRDLGVRTIEVPLPRQVQHLLGMVQIVDRDLVLVRHQIATPSTMELLRELGFTVVTVDESEEITRDQAMNVVVVAPRAVVLPTGVPHTRTHLTKAGIDVAAEVDISELRKAAGGIACATGIVSRETDQGEP